MGYLRLILSLVIMAGHVGPRHSMLWWPAISVLGFYALSGYLSAYSMDNHYQGRPLLYMLSRLARLYPVYLMSLLIAGALVAVFQGSQFFAPGQLFMIVPYGFDTLLPTAWILKWMMLGYLMIAAGLMGNLQRAWVCTAVAGAATVWLALAGDTWETFYKSPWLAITAIGMGAMAYWAGFVVPRDGRWAAWGGAMSYPVFLLHPPIATALPDPNGWPRFFVALPPTLAASWLLWRGVQVPVDRFRKSLKES